MGADNIRTRTGLLARSEIAAPKIAARRGWAGGRSSQRVYALADCFRNVRIADAVASTNSGASWQ